MVACGFKALCALKAKKVVEIMGEIVIKSEDYSLLKDLTVKFEAQEEGFTFCFWVYLLKTCTFPAPLISQVLKVLAIVFLAFLLKNPICFFFFCV